MDKYCRGRAGIRSAAAAMAAAAFALAAVPAGAQDFYQGKTIHLIVGAGPGGGHDTYARTIANHIGKHIPGNPTVVVENMPGAGSSKAAEYIATNAPKDGTYFAAVFPGAIVGPLLDERFDARYEPTELSYLGTADSGTRVCATFHTAETKSFEDARDGKTIVGASAAGGSTRDYPLFLNNLAGAKFEIITGYEGTREITLAMERGEVDAICGFDWTSLKSQRSDWVEEGKLNIILQTALEPNPELAEMGVPVVWDYVGDAEREVIELIVSQQVFGRPYVAPPGLPEDRLKILREAFVATMNDPDFLAEAEKAELSINPLDGERVETLVKKLYATPKDVVERAKEAMKPAG